MFYVIFRKIEKMPFLSSPTIYGRSIFEQVEKWNCEKMPKQILDATTSEEENESDNEDVESVYSEQGYETVSMVEEDVESLEDDESDEVSEYCHWHIHCPCFP